MNSGFNFESAYGVAAGEKPFVTKRMTMKFDVVWSSPVAGAHSEYLALFLLDGYVLPPGSAFHVTGLAGTISEPSVPLLPPKEGCGGDIR